MKNCEKCDKKIKNGFKMCYSCNESKSEISELETETAKPYVKDKIPRAVKIVFGLTTSVRNESVSVLVANGSRLQ